MAGKNTFSTLRKGHNLAAFKMVSTLVDAQGVIQWDVSIRLILASGAPLLSEKTKTNML